jgi:hypothetical protein
MRKLILAALVLAIAGCATAPIVSQTIPSERVGTYRLLAVQHQAVPEILSEGPQAGTEILGGQLVLNNDGTFLMRIDARAKVSSLEPIPFTRSTEGTYASSTVGVTLTSKDGALNDGAYFGTTLSIYRDGIQYLFIKN